MKYTQVKPDGFKQIVLNAGLVCSDFEPGTGTCTIIGVTSGGMNFSTNPTYEDFGEGMDNVPAKTMELMRLLSVDPTLSGTFVTISVQDVKLLAGAGSVSGNKFIPNADLSTSDFSDIWFVCDYSDKNAGETAGYVAILIKNALNTSGFELKSNDKGKGEMAFEFHGHYSMANIENVPYEIYVKAGT